MIECPDCNTQMPQSARFCPDCHRPRTTTKEELVALAHEMQRDYQDLRDAALDADRLPAGSFDRLDQYIRIKLEMLPSEELYAVYDLRGRGTGFVGITNWRLIIRDDGRVIHNGAMVSLPYPRISVIAHGLKGIGSTIILQTVGGKTIDLDLMNRDGIAVAHRLILQHTLSAN